MAALSSAPSTSGLPISIPRATTRPATTSAWWARRSDRSDHGRIRLHGHFRWQRCRARRRHRDYLFRYRAQLPDRQQRAHGGRGAQIGVTTVGFGCMVTSDGSVVERAVDIGITYFDTARNYQTGNNERMVGAALRSE